MDFTFSTIETVNCLFDGNIGDSITHGMIVTSSKVTLTSTLVQNSKSNETVIGFFNLISQSELLLRDNTMFRNISSKQNFLVSKALSNLTMSNNVTIANITVGDPQNHEETDPDLTL
jgi:hypothetical protein